MTATKLGEQALPTNAPTVTKEYTPGIGETETKAWRGERTDIDTKYTSLKSSADAGGEFDGNVTGLTSTSAEGRASLVLKLERSNVINEYGTNTKMVEELYAVNVVRDIRIAPYFSVDAGTKLTNDQIAWVDECVEEKYDEDQIDEEAVRFTVDKPLYAAWTVAMKELRNHLSHGVKSYFETGFVLRRTLFGVITSQIQASFVGINQIATNAPGLSSAMEALILSMPTGEWLYMPPQAELMTKGKWRITQEWHYAPKWSIVYGGSFHL